MSEAIKQLRELALDYSRKQHPTMPEYVRSVKNYNIKTANGLARAIIDFLRFSGWQAERINCTGKMIDNTKVITDVLGDRRSIGSVKWLPTSGQPGTSDISAVINGKACKFEIKIGKDRQSEAQRKYQEQIELEGGIYLIVKDFDSFINWYNEQF